MANACRVVLLAILLGVVGAASVSAGTFTHSGSLIAVNEGKGTIALAEVGPWRVVGGATTLTRRTIEVMSATEWVFVHRSAEPASGFPGDFVAEAIERWGVYPGEFVTVEGLHRGARLIALKITVVKPEEP